MRALAPVLLALLVTGCAAPARVAPAGPPWPAERTDPALQAAVERLAEGFEGVVGVYVRHLPTGRTAALRADTLFPSASLVKVPILVGVMQRVHDGDLGYADDLVFRDSLRYPSDLVSQLQDGATVPLHQMVELMLSASDNSASLWLQTLAGGGAGINAWLDREGFRATRVNSRTPGREADRTRTGWGQTTPREMAELVRRIVDAEAIAPDVDDRMHRALTRTFYDGEAVSELPPGVQAATKQGAVMQSRSEVLYVHAPSGPYLFCVVTKNQTDTRYTPDNAGYVLLRAYSRLFWQTFEPGSAWRPVPGAERVAP